MYYDISDGRFTQMDTARDGLNWYAYCGNNPVRFVDPSGFRTYIVNGINNSEETGAPQYSIDLKNELSKLEIENVKEIGVYNGTNVWTGFYDLCGAFLFARL